MDPIPEKTSPEPRVPSCPCCGGPLILLRGFWRCPRCQYRICEDCDGDPGTEPGQITPDLDHLR
jgi:hypothetical protein